MMISGIQHYRLQMYSGATKPQSIECTQHVRCNTRITLRSISLHILISTLAYSDYSTMQYTIYVVKLMLRMHATINHIHFNTYFCIKRRKTAHATFGMLYAFQNVLWVVARSH